MNDPRAFLTGLFEAAVSAADPNVCIAGHLPQKPKGRTVVIGAGSRADPPPQTSATTRSSSVRPETHWRRRFDPSRPLASGTGWLASSTSTERHSAP